jgi:hypothetical protein
MSGERVAPTNGTEQLRPSHMRHIQKGLLPCSKYILYRSCHLQELLIDIRLNRVSNFFPLPERSCYANATVPDGYRLCHREEPPVQSNGRPI